MFTADLSAMGEKEGSNTRKNVQIHEINRRPRINLPAIRGFLSQFLGKLQKHLKSRFKKPTEQAGANREMFKLKDAKFNLDKQLQVWRRNPLWDDHQPPFVEDSAVSISQSQSNCFNFCGFFGFFFSLFLFRNDISSWLTKLDGMTRYTSL